MRRILHVIDHLGWGGAQSALLDLVSNRDPALWECEVAAMHGRGPFAGALESLGLRVHSLSTSTGNISYVPRFVALARDGDFDVVHFHLQGANWIAKPLAALSCPALRISHDHASGDLRFRGMLSLLPDAVSHLFSHHVIAVSPAVKSFLTRFEALPDDDVTIVPNGIDIRLFTPPTADHRRDVRNAMGLNEKDFIVGSMGRLAKEKNFPFLARVARLFPEGVFVIGGEGPQRENIREAFRLEGCPGQLRLTGAIQDRPNFYAALDAFAIPSLYEGLPMVLLEAMASGVPVVTSQLPDLSHALAGGDFGLLADPTRPETFAQGLASLRDNPNSTATLADLARKHCQKEFSASASAQKIETLYCLASHRQTRRDMGWSPAK